MSQKLWKIFGNTSIKAGRNLMTFYCHIFNLVKILNIWAQMTFASFRLHYFC